MVHLIDKDALVAKIEGLQGVLQDPAMNRESMQDYAHGGNKIINEIRSFIDSLEVKEVDLEKECDNWRHNHFHDRRDKGASGEYLERSSQLDLAKHFFELGLRYKSSYVSIPNIDDTLKEMGVDPDSKIVKIFKELYYPALEKLKEKKGE